MQHSLIEISYQPSNLYCQTDAKGWIISPAVDLLFVCGGALFLLVAMHQIATQHFAAHQLSYLNNLALLGALTLGETHTVSTIFCVHADSHCLKRNGRFSLAMGILALLLFVAICMDSALAPYMVRLYLLSVSWHFVEQTRGIMIVYFARYKYQPTAWQRLLWYTALRVVVVNWMLVQLGDFFDNRGEVFLAQKLSPLTLCPKPLVQDIACLTVSLLIAIVSNLIWRALRREKLPPLPAVVLLFVVVALFLPIGPGVHLQQSLWLYAPALFHGSQYLCLVACRLSKNTDMDGQSKRSPSPAMLYGFSLCLSTLIFIVLPCWLAFIFADLGLSYAVALVAVFVSVQFYHMAMDSVIWKRTAPVARLWAMPTLLTP